MTRLLAALSLVCGLLPAQAKLTPLNEISYRKMVAGHKGRVLLVDFWATWCVPCRAEMPKLVQMSARLRSRGFDLVTVSADEPEKELAAFKVLMENSVAPPLFIKKAADDDKFYAAIDAKWSGEMPALFIYDRAGRRVRAFLGETPIKDIEAAVAKVP